MNNVILPSWHAPKQIKAYTTLRTKTREDILRSLSLPSTPIQLTQKHTAIVIEADLAHSNPIADATFTSNLQQVCAVETADCLPVLLCDKQGTEVAAIHAGWRGLSAGIIESTLQAMRCSATDIMAWLGPAIGPQKFEVGKDVYDAFVSQDTTAQTAFVPYREEKWLANLYLLAKMRLMQQGVNAIYGGDYCTYTQEEMFFSYRRDNGKTGQQIGRMLSLIWIDGALS
ncbi:MAG TPA: peptidoglycan editing factor PgeF [Gammaproteobacteria bacterium]|jgi:YfiH family protein|nr:peptidoglycan editing factor PgeF [Gammaproteobacteria bacterium]